MTYRIKPEYLEQWGSEATTETILTEEEIKASAAGWETTVEALMEQLYPNTPSEVRWHLDDSYLKHI